MRCNIPASGSSSFRDRSGATSARAVVILFLVIPEVFGAH